MTHRWKLKLNKYNKATSCLHRLSEYTHYSLHIRQAKWYRNKAENDWGLMKCSEDLFIWCTMQNIGQYHHSKTLFRCFLFSPPFKMHTVRQELPLILWLIPEHFDCFNIKRATRVLHSTTVLHSGDSIFNFKVWFSFLAGFSFYA